MARLNGEDGWPGGGSACATATTAAGAPLLAAVRPRRQPRGPWTSYRRGPAVVGTSASGPGGQEVLGVGCASELLAYQPGQVQQCGPGPVVGHDVLRLPGGVAGDQDDIADLPAPADLGRVVLQEAVLAIRAGEGEVLGDVERADGGHDGPDGLGALSDAVHRR